MKILLAIVVIALTACSTTPLTPTSVNPILTDITNNIKAVIAANNGDCNQPISPIGPAASCAPLPDTTTTGQQNVDSLIACALGGGANTLYAQFVALKALRCPASVAAPAPVKANP